MRECNKCGKQKRNRKFRHEDKKTCIKCEFRFKVWLLRKLTYVNKLTSYQKFASRVGYMGSGFLIAAQWTIEPYLYFLDDVCTTTNINPITYKYGSIVHCAAIKNPLPI
jgi:hypothetical protein